MAPPEPKQEKNERNGALNNEMTMDSSQKNYNNLIFYVNGERIEVNDVDVRTTLATFLRENCKFLIN